MVNFYHASGVEAINYIALSKTKYYKKEEVFTLTPPMFGETRFATQYLQQMTLRSKISKIIDTSLQNN